MPSYPDPAKYKVVQLRRGSTADIEALLGAQGEVLVDLDKKTLVVHDAIQVGGYPLRRDDAEYARSHAFVYKTAVVQNGVPFLGVTVGTNPPTAIIVQTSGVIVGAASFRQNQFVQGNFTMPDNWPASPITVDISWRTNDLVEPIIWTIQVAGIANGSTYDSLAFGSPIAFPTYTPTIAGELVTTTVSLDSSQIPSVVSTGEFYFQFSRGEDESSQTADLFSIRFNVDRYGF